MELKTKLDTLTSGPRKKYPFPMTSNQEIGWESEDVSLILSYLKLLLVLLREV